MARKNKNKTNQNQMKHQNGMHATENCSMSNTQSTAQQGQNCNKKYSSENCK